MNASTAIGSVLEKSSNNFMNPEKNVMGPFNFYHRQVVDSTVLAQAAIDKFYNHPEEPVVILADYSDNEKLQDLYAYLQKHYSETRQVLLLPLFDNEDQDHKGTIQQFLLKPEGILIAHPDTFNGAQARNTIIIHSSIDDFLRLRNITLRTMSKTVIITEVRAKVQKVPGLYEDLFLHEFDVGVPIPICFHYKDSSRLSQGEIANSIVQKYFLQSNETIIFIKFDERKMKQIVEGLQASSYKYENIEYREYDETNLQKNMMALDAIIDNTKNNCPEEDRENEEELEADQDSDIEERERELEEIAKETDEIKRDNMKLDFIVKDINKEGFNLLQNPGTILIAKVDHNFTDKYLTFLSHAKNIVVYIDKEQDSAVRASCRNMLLRAKPKVALVIHDGCIDEFQPFFDLKEDTHLAQ